MIRKFRTALAHFLDATRREDGTSTIEFCFAVPMFLFMFMGSFDSGLLMLRDVMLNRALDLTMRELRLGHFDNPTHESVKHELCLRTVVIQDCEKVVKLELRPIDNSTWDLPTTSVPCVDRSANIDVASEFRSGGGNQLMIVRACAIVQPMFPGTGIGLRMPKDAEGGYGLVARSAFVNEPG
jgi:hypothetical protein